MARQITIEDDAHRIEQAVYRARLEDGGVPEAPQADTAVTIAVYGLLREIARKQPKRMRQSREEFLSRAAAVLAAQGYDRERSLAVLRRRLVRPPERFDTLLGEDTEDQSGLLP